MTWRCPNCHATLNKHPDTQALRCINGHSFDRAKQGYYNLLLANKKSSLDPGDNADMVNARHLFLAKGYYAPLADALIAQLINDDSPRTVLDCGCGEGYYSRRISESMDDMSLTIYGIDISKHALRKAASKTQHNWAVASSYDIPLPDHSTDLAFSVFAPFSAQEVQRVLKKDGLLIRVLSGADHLVELKEIVYQKAEQHKPPKAIEGFAVARETSLAFDMNLTEEKDRAALLAMTPFTWSAKTARAIPNQVHAHFIIQVFRAKF